MGRIDVWLAFELLVAGNHRLDCFWTNEIKFDLRFAGARLAHRETRKALLGEDGAESDEEGGWSLVTGNHHQSGKLSLAKRSNRNAFDQFPIRGVIVLADLDLAVR